MALLDEDRLFPPDDRGRDLARAIYATVRDLPIISPHGHTDPRWFADNAPFADPAALFVTPDHYVFRMLYSPGRAAGGSGRPAPRRRGRPGDPREIWRLFARALPSVPRHAVADLARPCASAMSSASTGRCPPTPPTRIYDHIDDCLARPDVPAARAVRALRHRGDRDHRKPARRPATTTQRSRAAAGTGGSSPPTAPMPWSTRTSTASRTTSTRFGELTGEDTAHLGRLPRRAPRAGGPSSPHRRHRHRPRPPDGRAPRTCRSRGRGAVRNASSKARPRRRTPSCSAARC